MIDHGSHNNNLNRNVADQQLLRKHKCNISDIQGVVFLIPAMSSTFIYYFLSFKQLKK